MGDNMVTEIHTLLLYGQRHPSEHGPLRPGGIYSTVNPRSKKPGTKLSVRAAHLSTRCFAALLVIQLYYTVPLCRSETLQTSNAELLKGRKMNVKEGTSESYAESLKGKKNIQTSARTTTIK